MELSILTETNTARETLGELAQKMGRRSERSTSSTIQTENDQLHLSESLSDSEAFALLGDVQQNIFDLPLQALRVHGGLNPERVNALLNFDF